MTVGASAASQIVNSMVNPGNVRPVVRNGVSILTTDTKVLDRFPYLFVPLAGVCWGVLAILVVRKPDYYVYTQVNFNYKSSVQVLRSRKSHAMFGMFLCRTQLLFFILSCKVLYGLSVTTDDQAADSKLSWPAFWVAESPILGRPGRPLWLQCNADPVFVVCRHSSFSPWDGLRTVVFMCTLYGQS